MKADGLDCHTTTWTVRPRFGIDLARAGAVTSALNCAYVRGNERPIVGDNIYGKAPRTGGPALHLHSREVTVPISKNKPAVKVTAPVPEHMRGMLSTCGWTREIQ
jgi:hypothetical protein